MNSDLRRALDAKLLRMADDEFILGHRNSEWTAHGPLLEEDIAFSNLALDELGHAILWYRIVSTLRNEDPERYPDKLVYRRTAAEFRNRDVVALPHTDWAFSMLRQFLFDAYESVHLPALCTSRYEPVSEAAAKIGQEETYHLHHTKTWMLRLGRGTVESNRRLQSALDQLWNPFQQFFIPGPDEALVVEAGFTPELKKVHAAWQGSVLPILESCQVAVPQETNIPQDGKTGCSSYMQALVDELQEVSRIAPDAVW